jgi:oligopeptide/dipeptide ABC transporter ATP-binding protein
MIFQEPMTSLNPLMTCGRQIVETITSHEKMNKAEAKERALAMIRSVGIARPEKVFSEVPAQLSGGMRQRIMIAMALICRPRLLICDEPTTALDVTVQAQILGLIRRLQKETGTSVIFISHDMGVISQMADRVAVMYAGQLVEYAEGEKIFTEPEHPYTQGLQAAIPRLDEEKDTLLSIPGNVPMLYDLPKGCIFSPRCAHATEQCRNERPELVENSGHLVRCFLYEDNKKHTESQSKGGAQA